MTNAPLSIDPVELLDALKGYPLLAPYSLAVFSLNQGVLASRGTPPPFCATPGQASPSCSGTRCPLEQAAREAISSAAPTICHCHLGVQGFATLLDMAGDSPCCLVGWGVRSQSINLSYLEKLTQTHSMDPFALLDQWGNLPAATTLEVRQVAEKVQSILPSLQGDHRHSSLLEKTVGQLTTIVGISSQIDKAKTPDTVVKLLSESLGIYFDFPMIAVGLPDKEPQALAVRGTWGMPDYLRHLAQDRFIIPHQERSFILHPVDFHELFQGIPATRATCFSLTSENGLLGILLLFNVELHPRDVLQVEILCDKVSARLNRLLEEVHPLFDSSLPDRLISMISSLAAAATRKELYHKILECAASLQNASSGSIMLMDDTGTSLSIEAAIGINSHISRNMKIKIGEGIAGKVAATGKPMLVNDIENDSRMATTNRPRFKTKSFLSVPLRLKDRVIGVVNLSDKENQGIFTDADLQLLTVLTTQACILIERSELQERTSKLEQLTMSDALTGLYNGSCIIRRMDEEQNRSSRQELTFSILLIELDYFSLHVELCGQQSSDKVLKRTAAILCACARQMDAVARFRDETFCIILPGTSKGDAFIVADRIRTAIANESFPCEENLPTGKLTASIGIAAFPEDGGDTPSLLTATELALYQAKAEGRNRIRTASIEPSSVTSYNGP